MFITKIKRVFRAGLVNFWRKGFVSSSALVIMFIALFIITSIIFTSAILSFSLQEVKDKVDIEVYFTDKATELDILSLKNKIEAIDEVASVVYVSKEQALIDFKERNKEDFLILSALEEVGENPLSSFLSIKAKSPSQYEGIVKFFNNDDYLTNSSDSFIEKVSYLQRKVIIDRLTKIIDTINKIGFWLIIILLIIAVVIIFNTIRLVIFISKDEIAVMRLVGASERYIKGPFVVSGILYGFVSATLVTIVFLFLTYFLSPSFKEFSGGLDLYGFYLNNFGQISLIVFSSGIGLGAISSYLAVRKYLKF